MTKNSETFNVQIADDDIFENCSKYVTIIMNSSMGSAEWSMMKPVMIAD